MKPLSNQYLSEQHSIWLYVVLALGYFFSGQLLSGMSAQSQVVAIWAPAGFALVGCYLWWWRFFPAVFFASLAFNLQTHESVQFIDMAADLGLEVSMIAFGATLQAAVGSFLMRNWLGDPLYLRSDQRAIGFIFIVGIIVNLISPNIGVQALSLYNSSYSAENHWNNVLYWWLGDSLGVLITTPLLLSLIDMQASKERKKHLLVLSAAGLLFTSVTLTTLFFSQNSYHNAQELAKRELKVVENGLYRQLNSSLNQIQLLGSFVQVNPNVNRHQFDEFVSELMQDQPSIKAMSWNPLITQEQTKSFEQKLSTIYNKKMNIKGKPLNDSDPIVVVQLISPEKGNSAAIGFNVYSNPKRKSVLSTGHRPHQVLATPIIRLVQSEVAEPGYLLFMPVYSLSTDSQTNDNNQLLGYATGVFLASRMINDALGLSQTEMFFYELYENTESVPFTSNTGQAELMLHLDDNHLKLSFDLAGQTWHMNLTPNKEFLSHYQSRLTLMVYILQVVLVGFIMLLILLMNNRQIVLNLRVADRTQALELAKQQSDDASKAKSRFLANMSHEIRTPLNAVIGFSQLAKNIDDKDVLNSYIDKIELSSSNLLNIINDILDISKIESQKFVLEHILFDMHQLLTRVAVMFENHAPEKSIEWRVIDQLPTRACYLSDPVRIEQILINLVGNAYKFTQQGEIQLFVEQFETVNDKVNVRFTVKDSGIGINETAQATLFDAFTQADTSTSRRFGGTGLGLTISKELSELMDGNISVQSELGEGSSFVVNLTLTMSDETPEETTTTQLKNISNMRVLVAEDNLINQVVIEEFLKTFDIVPTVVCDGAEALEIVQKQKFDVVLMDCQMPVMDGYEATRQIRRLMDKNQLPIVALTADVMPEEKQMAVEAGFNAHLSKPINVNDLGNTLALYKENASEH